MGGTGVEGNPPRLVAESLEAETVAQPEGSPAGSGHRLLRGFRLGFFLTILGEPVGDPRRHADDARRWWDGRLAISVVVEVIRSPPEVSRLVHLRIHRLARPVKRPGPLFCVGICNTRFWY